ncbi:unnamed protein product [Spirodela intermedia]|uniref:Uncharacterized protein n=2 Tax=Spirodela intermedia TaxID=51605 RepID=A0A7I8JWY7_SPIIN|nr:unnamed protein product [Spirodela intermedia]CAA6653913.1 unnamed protein product [Spirodela intermedia]CAA7388345.1 unnamed protein product [Spirodela intermedia]
MGTFGKYVDLIPCTHTTGLDKR